MLYTARVRGIYATALSWLLSRHGFLLSDVSEVLRRRLPGPPSQRAPDVTIKSLDDNPDHILVLGYPWEAGEEVAKLLRSTIEYHVYRRGVYGLYTILDVESLGSCKARGPGGVEVVIDANDCPGEGEKLRVTVVRESLEAGRSVVVKPGVRVVGRYTIVSMPGEGVSYSEHIRDDDKKLGLLLALPGGGVDTRRAHVRFRSSSKLAPDEEAASEAGELYREAEKLLSEPPGEPQVVRRGEFIALIGLPRPAKEYLDTVRRELVPTLDGHHSLKSFGDRESSLVDCAEETGMEPGHGRRIEFFLAKKSLGRKVSVYHVKPSGEKIRLGPFTVTSASMNDNGIELVLERHLRGGGVLDGLNVEKKPGDRAISRLWTGRWFLIHEYISQEGQPLGVYANVNTPPEVGAGKIKYFDLLIDVVKKPGEPARIIDREELDQAYEEGIVSEALYKKALETAEYLKRLLDSTYK